MAANKFSLGDHAIQFGPGPPEPPGTTRNVHAIPSVEVIARLNPAPDSETAQSVPISDAYAIPVHCCEPTSALTCCVQLIPSGDVWTFVPAAPLSDIATNNPIPDAQSTSVKLMLAASAPAIARSVQTIPSGEVATRGFPAPARFVPTATKRFRSGDHVTAFGAKSVAVNLFVQIDPSGDDCIAPPPGTAKYPTDAKRFNAGDHATSCALISGTPVITSEERECENPMRVPTAGRKRCPTVNGRILAEYRGSCIR